MFSRNVTGSVDSFPIIIHRPKGSNNMQRWFYNGKYACHVLKVRYSAITSIFSAKMPEYRITALLCSILQVQAVCDHRGNIIWYSGPHIGVTSDVRLWQQYTPPLIDGEKVLGDKAYVGCPDEIIVPFKKQRGQSALSKRREAFNLVHAWYRATIEHCFAYVKRSANKPAFDARRFYR